MIRHSYDKAHLTCSQLLYRPHKMIIESTPEPEINEDTPLEEVRRQITETRADNKRLKRQIARLQEDNRERIIALEESFQYIMQLAVGLGEKVEQFESLQ